MLKHKMLGGASIVAVALLAGVWGTSAWADTATDTENASTEVEGVTVTGTYIAGTETQAIPVQVVGQAELEAQGSPSVLEVLKNLPISGPTLGESNQFSVAAQGRSGGGNINLRGLGAQRTLVLLNGRRFAGGTADTNWLPVAAIGRVELLKDGAGATYGSDAIGGVANFITRTNVNGLEAAGSYRYVRGAEEGDFDLSAVAGWSNDMFNVMGSVGYQHRGELHVYEREFTRTSFVQNPSGWSVLGNPGTWYVRGGALNANNSPVTPIPVGAPTTDLAQFLAVRQDANCAAVNGTQTFTSTLPACYFSYLPFDNLVETQTMWQAYAEVNANFSDMARLHVEALYANNDIPHIRFSPGYPPTSGPNGPGSTLVYSVPATNPGFAAFLTQSGGNVAGATHAYAWLWRPFANGGNPSQPDGGGQTGSRNYEYTRFSASLRGEIFEGLNYDIAATWIHEYQNQQTTDILITRLQAALNGFGGPSCTGNVAGANGCQWYNPFSNAYPGNPVVEGFENGNPGFIPANANNPALVAWLFDRQIFVATQNTWVLDGVLSGELPFFSLGGGQIGWAAGAQYRTLEFDQSIRSPFYDAAITPCPVVGDTNCAFRTGPYIFLGQNINLGLSQDVWALFGELHLPFTETIDAQLAVRYENYGGQTGSTTNPQFRIKWQATDWFALRGSVGTSFRGPTAGNVAPVGVTGLSGIAAANNNFKSVDFFGNPAVGPESAFTYSLGAILQTHGVTATLDYWSYRVEDQITTVPANIVGNAVANGPGNGSQFVNCSHALRNLVTFNNNNTCTQGVTIGNDIARIRSDTVNGPTINTTGIDLSVNWRFPAEVLRGDLSLGADVSYVLTYKQEAFIVGGVTVSGPYSAVGFTNYDRLPGTMPSWRGQFYADWHMGPHNLRWQVNYIDGVTDNRGPTTVQTGSSTNCNVANATAGIATNCVLTTFGLHLDAFITNDVTYRLDLPRNTTLGLTVQNIFDVNPPGARLELSYDPFVGNPLGRTAKITLRTRF